MGRGRKITPDAIKKETTAFKINLKTFGSCVALHILTCTGIYAFKINSKWKIDKRLITNQGYYLELELVEAP